MQNSLFIGRWQPFHDGHKALLETRLRYGKKVVIAIRDTEISEQNPYTISERIDMINEALIEYDGLFKTIVIPDIDEVCYGRGVGYEVTQINMPPNIKEISATEIRRQNATT
jgi:adenylylsulfate kinase